MNKLNTAVITLVSVMLVACSGGGGGNKNNESPQPTPQNNTANTAAENQTTNSSTTQSTSTTNNENQLTTSKVGLENTGHTIDKNNFQKGELNKEPVTYGNTKVAELSGYNRQYSFNGALMKTKESDSQIIVNGTKMLLMNQIKGTVGGLSGLALSKTLGTLYNVSKDPERDIFYFGYETPESNIPKQGVVTYKGNASRYDNVSNNVKNIGDSELIADFNQKTIKGELDMTYPRRNIALQETPIVGNGFSGKAVAEGNLPFFISQAGTYEGKFYGPNAEEVAGKAIFKEDVKDLNTSFSAEKVK